MSRRLRLAFAVVLSAAAAGVAAQPATAANGDRVQCAPKNAWCIAVFHKHGRIFFDFGGFGFTGDYQVCVTPPRRKETCRTFTLHANGTGANASSIRFTKNFPHSVHGQYEVRWIYQDQQIGRSLPFRY